ncbi:MAG: FAD-dependent oxidoreductase [Anaerolineales bacterium]|nr:FAD-dependent oxidoreductase [Anaerolineales bacterium]
MKIAIIGSGIAGLTTAWLLDGYHEVTLFEKNEILGGHALTVHFDIKGKRVFANPAAGYITPSIYPRFLQLLKILNIKLISIPASVTVYSSTLGHATMLTPRLSFARLAKLLHPNMLMHLLELQRTLLVARKFDKTDDWQTTLEEFMNQERVSQFVRNEIIYPWISAVGEATIEDIKGFSARAALKYPVHGQSGTQAFRLQELEGGIASYIKPFVDSLQNTQVKTKSGIISMEKQNDGFVLIDSSNTKHTFEHVIFASPACETKKIIDTLSSASELSNILSGFKYNPAKIAVHGDRSLMPPNKVDWSTYNTMYDGKSCEATIWCPEDGEREYFKSWVTFANKLPENLYSLHEFKHPLLTPEYYQSQEKLKVVNGKDNLWFAGSYTQDIDSHESGVCSAMEVTQKLNPDSRNLKLLLQ